VPFLVEPAHGPLANLTIWNKDTAREKRSLKTASNLDILLTKFSLSVAFRRFGGVSPALESTLDDCQAENDEQRERYALKVGHA